MTLDEIKNKIRYQESETGDRTIEVVGRLQIDTVYYISNLLGYQEKSEARRHVYEKVQEIILREIYEDRRKEFYNLVHDLYKCNPMDYSETRKVIEKLVECFHRQQPK